MSASIYKDFQECLMGMGGVSLWQLSIILLITVMLFGTGKLKTLGSDLGGAIKGFKQAMDDEDSVESQKVLNNKES